jgi:hypothetical protein
VRLGDPFPVKVRKDYFPGEKPDEEYPFPVQMQKDCFLDEGYQVLKLLAQPWPPEQPVLT